MTEYDSIELGQKFNLSVISVISVWEMRFVWFHIQEEKKFQCASNTLGQIWSYVPTYFINEFDFSPCINNFCMEGHTKQLLVNARISSIFIRNRMRAQRSTLSVWFIQAANALIWGGALAFYCEPQREKSQKLIFFYLQATIEDTFEIAHWRKAKQM